MANDFSRIGFKVKSDDDLKRIYSENRAQLNRMETAEGMADVLCPDNNAELWFYGLPGEAVLPALCRCPLRAGFAGVLFCIFCGCGSGSLFCGASGRRNSGERKLKDAVPMPISSPS